MLDSQFRKRAMKGTVSTEPLVDDDAQGILIAGWAWMSLDLFRSHICNRSSYILCMLVAGTLSHQGNAKVTEQDLAASPKQHILWLDIAVDKLLIMGVLQAIRDLLDITDDGAQRKDASCGVS